MEILGRTIPQQAADFFNGEWTTKWLRYHADDPDSLPTPIKAAERVVATFDPWQCWEWYTSNQAEFWVRLKRGGFQS